MTRTSTVASFIFALLFAFNSSAGLRNERIENIRKKMEAAEDTLNELKNENRIHFNENSDEQSYNVALRKIQTSIEELKKLASEMNAAQAYDIKVAIDEAKMIKDIMMSYLVPNSIFGLRLTSEEVSIDIDISVGMEEVFRRINRHVGFGGSIGGRFQVRSNTQEQKAAHFSKLKSAFYNALLEVSALDNTNVQLKALAEWGKNTEVATGFGSSFGEEIISFSEYNALRISGDKQFHSYYRTIIRKY